MGSHTPRKTAAAREPLASVRILAAGEIPVLLHPRKSAGFACFAQDK
jgi:hypothetical protein